MTPENHELAALVLGQVLGAAVVWVTREARYGWDLPKRVHVLDSADIAAAPRERPARGWWRR